MFLPNQLPTQLKNQHQNSEKGQRKRSKMQRIIGKKKKAYDRADEMLAPPASPTSASQIERPLNSNNANLMVRGWARISGRKRHRRKVPNLESNNNNSNNFGAARNESGTMLYNLQNGRRESGFSVESTWPMIRANSNLSRVAHLSENTGRTEDETERKRHFLNRGMDRIRRSIRRSFRKSGSSGCHQSQALTQSSVTANDGAGAGGTQSASEGPSAGAGAKNYCHADEIAVRSAACSFVVKYLGACEVFESRGMSVCESALQHLRARKRVTKALLYISGDGIRVVDQEHNRGLIVDQTIEKVSFCAPDRSNEKGFSYICRDGATRRWMCHGFHAAKDTGERLSHAVGCAFTVCLEKKRKRDAETAAYRNAQALAHTVELDSGIEDNCGGGGAEFARTNQAYGSFRQLSISERRSDPQKAILVDGKVQQTNNSVTVSNRHSMPSIPTMPTVTPALNASTPRPSGNPSLFERSGSLRAPNSSSTVVVAANANANANANVVVESQQQQQCQQQIVVSQFARFCSLQPKNNMAKRFGTMPRMSLHNEPIWEGDVEEEIGIGTTTTTNNGDVNGSANNVVSESWDFNRGTVNSRQRFYRTLPHTMPNIAPTNWCTFEPSIPTTILEEEKQCNPRESPSPADPFHTKMEVQQQQQQQTQCQPTLLPRSPARADFWLADIMQKAASLSTLAPKTDGMPMMAQLLPHSQSFGTGQRVEGQQNWHENATKMNASNNTMPKLTDTVVSDSKSSLIGYGCTTANTSSLTQQIAWANSSEAASINWANNPRLLQASPRLPQSPPVVLASDMADSMASGVRTATNGGASTSRKPSRQIEYQLLQEMELPHSPPPKGMSMLANNQQTMTNANTNAVDPFDVNWSQRVLEQSALKLMSPRAIPPLPQRRKANDGTTFDQKNDQTMRFDQKSDQTMRFDQNNPFSNGKTPPVNV
ncbi:hypothetical protein niasHS_004866 [Heterodera schachtii]|uniref:PID domain-containing protein n=1 Tax=Heterodera schachtii TaxID=97005 RepID=A0ABD2JLH2_HETSC